MAIQIPNMHLISQTVKKKNQNSGPHYKFFLQIGIKLDSPKKVFSELTNNLSMKENLQNFLQLMWQLSLMKLYTQQVISLRIASMNKT